jgi:hypothetical protein
VEVLFGGSVLAQAKQIRLEDMGLDADLVAEGARQLLEAEGEPVRQRANWNLVSCRVVVCPLVVGSHRPRFRFSSLI